MKENKNQDKKRKILLKILFLYCKKNHEDYYRIFLISVEFALIKKIFIQFLFWNIIFLF